MTRPMAQCAVCLRWFPALVTGLVRWHGDKIHYPVRTCLGAGKEPAQ